MPWHIEEKDGEYCVVKDSDDTVEGCHESEDGAEAQMSALYASEAERVGLIDWFLGKVNRILLPFTNHEPADEEPQEEQSMGDRVVGLEMAFDQIYDQMWEDDDLSGSWIHDLYLGDGDPFLIVSKRGKLYRVALDVAGDSVNLSDMEPVEITFQPTERLATKTVIREVEEGVYRWFSISATSVLNKDGEIDSQALFDSFVDHIDRTGEYPVRRFHHVNHESFVTGECDFVARSDHALITSGIYNDGKLAELEVKAQLEEPDEWGESIGYLPTEPPELIRVSDVEIPAYNEGVLREISTVRKENACSWFTTTALREEVMRMGLRERAREGLLKLFGGDEDAMQEFIADIDLTNREIAEENLISREDTEEDEGEDVDGGEEVQTRSEEEHPQEVILDDDALDAIVERFSATLEPFMARIEALEASLETQREAVSSTSDEVAEALDALTERVEVLEKGDEEKIEEALADKSPKMNRVNVGYRPRVERKGDDEEDQGQPLPMESTASDTLAAIPQ